METIGCLQLVALGAIALGVWYGLKQVLYIKELLGALLNAVEEDAIQFELEDEDENQDT